jgi:hypothetical protein
MRSPYSVTRGSVADVDGVSVSVGADDPLAGTCEIRPRRGIERAVFARAIGSQTRAHGGRRRWSCRLARHGSGNHRTGGEANHACCNRIAVAVVVVVRTVIVTAVAGLRIAERSPEECGGGETRDDDLLHNVLPWILFIPDAQLPGLCCALIARHVSHVASRQAAMLATEDPSCAITTSRISVA